MANNPYNNSLFNWNNVTLTDVPPPPEGWAEVLSNESAAEILAKRLMATEDQTQYRDPVPPIPVRN
jgi:hypothetical protein